MTVTGNRVEGKGRKRLGLAFVGLIAVVCALHPVAFLWAAGDEARAKTTSPAVVLQQPIQNAGATLDVTLRAADSATLSSTLGVALGGTVRIEGTLAAPVTLDLHGASARAALDAVGAAVHGNWHPVYTVTTGAPPVGARHPVPLGRTVTARFEKVSARAVLGLVARAGGGPLEAPADLTQSVTLAAKEMPVEQALDDVTRQMGATWSVAYVIRAGTAPPAAPTPTSTSPAGNRTRTSSPSPAGQPTPGRGRAGSGGPFRSEGNVPGFPFSPSRSFPVPPASLSPSAPATSTPDPNAAKQLEEGLARVMQMPPAQRGSAVRDFAAQLEQQFRQMQALPGSRRADQMATMRPLYQAAGRTYNGLTPDQRREFQPIIDVFNRWMR